MHPGGGVNRPGHDRWERRADHAADEARLARLLTRTYAAREARLTPADDALAKLNVALDALATTPRRQTDHRRLFGACALVAVLLLLLSPVARAEFAGTTGHAQRSVVTPMHAGVGNDAGTSSASGRAVLPPVTVAASVGGTTTVQAPAANGTAPMTGATETPLRDLLARAGIRAADPASSPSGEGKAPQH